MSMVSTFSTNWGLFSLQWFRWSQAGSGEGVSGRLWEGGMCVSSENKPRLLIFLYGIKLSYKYKTSHKFWNSTPDQYIHHARLPFVCNCAVIVLFVML